MAAPKKPDYPALRKRIERMHTGVVGDIDALLALHARALWLEDQSGKKPRVSPVALQRSSDADGKGFRGPDFKKGKDK